MPTDEVFEVQCPPFDLTLSDWDRRMVTAYSKRILCFQLAAESSPEQAATTLKRAFELTIRELPWLAGCIVPFPVDRGGAPWLVDIAAEGSGKLIIKDLSAELSFHDLQKSGFNQSLLYDEKLCPLNQGFYDTNEHPDVCQFQANFIKGGLLLAVSIIHCVSDGGGITEVLRVFAKKVMLVDSSPEDTKEVVRSLTTDQPYHCDRLAALRSNQAHGDIDLHKGWFVGGSPPNAFSEQAKFVSKTFEMTSEKLMKLKATAASTDISSVVQHHSLEECQSRISTHDSILALQLRTIALAKHKAGIADLSGDHVHLSVPINLRRHLNLPEPYFGNAISACFIDVSFDELQQLPPESGIALIACAIRYEIESFSAWYAHNFLAWVAENNSKIFIQPNILRYQNTCGLFATSYWSFDHQQIDFGKTLGHHIHALRLPRGGIYPGMSVVFPRTVGRGCEFMLNEREETMKCILEDECLRDFVVEWA